MAARVLPFPHPEEQPPTAEKILDDYLDHLCAPLVGLVPYDDRKRLRREVEENLEIQLNLYINDGLDPVAAALKAIDHYGESDQMAEEYLDEWVRHTPKGRLAKSIGLPNAYAIFFFGQATVMGELLVQFRVYWSNPEPYLFGLSLAQIRQIIPDPLPLPDSNPTWALFWAYILIAPLIAGWLTGRAALMGAAKAAFQVQIILCLFTFILGSAMLPTKEGIWLALVMVGWWVPIGTLVSHVASALYRRRRLRFQPSWRKKSYE